MFIKLGIIAIIVIMAGLIFSNEIGHFFPTTSATVIDSLKNDISEIGEKASNSAQQGVDKLIGKIDDNRSNSIINGISGTGEKLSNEISVAKESSQKKITEEVSNFDLVESIKNIFT